MSNVSSNQPKENVKYWPGVLIAIVLTAVVFVVGQVVGSLLMLGLSGLLPDMVNLKAQTIFGSGVAFQFAYAGLVYGIMTGALLWVLRKWRLSVADLGLVKRLRWSDLALAAAAFFLYASAYIILLSVVSPFIPGLDINQKQDVGYDGASGLSLILVYIALAIIAPVAEELLMRGFLFTSLRRRLRFWPVALLTSAVFACLHLPGGEAGAGPLWIAAFDTFVLSLVLCYLREKTGRLWAGIGVHMIKNSIAFAALFLFAAR